jgi:hypothetical protein
MRKGAANILTAVIFLIVIIVASGVWEYMRLITVTKEVRDAMEAATITTLADNAYAAYGSVREGYSGMYRIRDSEDYWDNIAVIKEILDLTAESLGMVRDGTNLRKLTPIGNHTFSLAVKSHDIRVETFGGDASNIRTTANIIVQTTIPHSFGWDFLDAADIDIGVEASFVSRF